LTVKARGIVLKATNGEAYVNGRLIEPPLSSNQLRLLALLLKRPGLLCTRDEIVKAVWPEANGGVSNDAIDELIKRLRRRLAQYHCDAIVSVPRQGYRLKSP
jgi:DNA-binding winged helix-turn-helix (wHTH) protein